MATKKQLAEQVLRKISGGNLKPDRQIDIREIMLDLDQLRDEYVKISFFENIKEGGYIIDQAFLSEYSEIAIGGSGYFTLPANPIDLPRNMGIYSVKNDEESLADQHIIIDANAGFIYQGKQVLNITGKEYTYFIGNKGYTTQISGYVSVVMAASSKDIAEDANYPLTPDAEGKILDALFNKYVPTKQIPHDEIEDGIK